MVKQIQYLMYGIYAIPKTFVTRIYIILFLSFAILLKSIDSCAGRDKPWPSTSDVITFDQNWHYLYSTSAGGKDLSYKTLIKVLSLMAPEICKKAE